MGDVCDPWLRALESFVFPHANCLIVKVLCPAQLEALAAEGRKVDPAAVLREFLDHFRTGAWKASVGLKSGRLSPKVPDTAHGKREQAATRVRLATETPQKADAAGGHLLLTMTTTTTTTTTTTKTQRLLLILCSRRRWLRLLSPSVSMWPPSPPLHTRGNGFQASSRSGEFGSPTTCWAR